MPPRLLDLLVSEGPPAFVYVAGLVWALAYWRRHRRPARMVLLGCSVLLLESVFLSIGGRWLLLNAYRYGWSAPAVQEAAIYLTALSSLAFAAGVALLIAAAFTGREKPASALEGPAA